MNCLACRGACCEVINVKNLTPVDEFPLATGQWLRARSIAQSDDGSWVLESRCPELTEDGLCSLHDTDEKPIACAVAPAGAPECLESIRLRRPAALYSGMIREEGDPTAEEVYGEAS